MTIPPREITTSPEKMRKKRFAGIRSLNNSANSIQQDSNSSLSYGVASPKSGRSQLNGVYSEFTTHYSDEDATPIPSLHGNLVRTRYKCNPLEFYETLQPLGEGSMGSVSKVRKRTEVIGGSARPDYVKSHSKPQVLAMFPFLQFCPLQREWSDASYKVSPATGSKHGHQGSAAKRDPGQSCFTMFCCPAKPPRSAVLEPINEDASLAGTLEGVTDNTAGQGCWGGLFAGLFSKRGTEERQPKQPPQSTNKGSDIVSSEDDDDKDIDDLLDKEDYEQIERQLERCLKRSTSSLITYGHKDSVYALKSIHLDRVSSSDFMKELKNEVSILKQLDHPNIVKCFETFHYNSSLFLVLEICSGGDLYTRDPYTEQQACRIVRAVLSAVAYMHSKQITHRDLKYENLMFTDASKDAEVKIIDFGLSKKYAADSFLHDTVGTVYTMAPELLRGGYTEKVDVWSLGVIAFMLLSSSMPFYGKDRKAVIKKIIKGNYQFISRRWKAVSSDAKAFVVRLLQHNPDKRPSAVKAMSDPWLISGEFDSLGFAPEVAMMDKVQATIQTFADYGRLKKLALMLIAYRCTTEEIGFLRMMFDQFDLRHDGEVTLEEFKTVLIDYDYSDAELERMFRAMDLDGTGLVHYSEFLAATIESHGSISEEQVAECFDFLDNDSSGYITKDDILNFLGGDIPQSYIDDIMAEADLNNDQKISYKEFLGLWDEKADAKMKKDHEDVKQRRHRRTDSAMSSASVASYVSDFSDDEFDELAFRPSFLFESNEILKLLEAPDTPVSGEKRISAVNAFVLEKEKSTRASSRRRESSVAQNKSPVKQPANGSDERSPPQAVYA